MAVLTTGSGGRRRSPVRAGLLAIAAYATLVAGCVFFEHMDVEAPKPSFSHARHAQEGLSCDDCHFPDAEGGPPRMPSAAQCDICHHKLDAGKPPERQAAALFVDGKLPGAPRLSSEIIFSHGYHTGYGMECGACHRGIETSTTVEPALMLTMDDCQRCHMERAVDPSCATCHHEIRTDVRPPNHTEAWQEIHGSVVRGFPEGPAENCALCHTEASCNECHAAVAPPNHNNLWRIKTHGVVAGMDRQNCAVCHRTDFCERCHEDTPPLSHKGGWGSPLDKHCVVCHFPLNSESCSICHHGTPSHKLAAPLPADHNPGMNCVQCHGLTAPLPHPDKGDACIMCHN
jgi:hypothetical protein